MKLIAASISKPLTHIFNLSLGSGIIPSQWKQAIIIPLQKIPNPLSCSDFRPTSLTTIPSCVLDKIVVRTFLYPIFLSPTHHQLFNDQFAFRPTGSTDAALISILHHITSLLASNSYIRVIALDFSKAFDTVRHASVLSKLSSLPIEDQFYNWAVNYFMDHSHVTKYQGSSSSSASINASVLAQLFVNPFCG